MESATELIPPSSRRSVEDRIFIAKLLQHISDYVKAVQKYGKDFYRLTADEEHYQGNAKHGDWRAQAKNMTLVNGRTARRFLFPGDDADDEAKALCETLGFNIAVIRHKLQGMNQKEAKKLWPKFLRGIEKGRYKEKESEGRL